MLVTEGKFSEAILYYTNVLNQLPDDPEIHNNLGVALFHSGKYEQAIGHFETALKIRPEYADARQNLKKALIEQP